MKHTNYLWLTRVPETIKEAKSLVEKASEEISWVELEKGYQVSSFSSTYGIESELNKKGRFILATNDLDMKNYPDEQILEEYKEQQGVERGFCFIKDPWFMVDSIFLKSNKRIEALMMVMTLCLCITIRNANFVKN